MILPVGHRFLKVGEELEKEDRFWSSHHQGWFPIHEIATGVDVKHEDTYIRKIDVGKDADSFKLLAARGNA